MKTKLLFLLCFIIFATFVSAQSSDLAWAKRIGGDTNATRAVYGPAVTTDEQGNSYMAGVFLNGTYKLDGISLTRPPRTSSGGYIAKYKPNGQIAWAKPLGNIQLLSDEVNITKIIIDKKGNIYFCGTNARDAASVIGNYYITDGFTSTIGNYKTHFLAKLDSNGNVLWVKTTNHPNYDSWKGYGKSTNELFFDPDGNINMTGGFKDYITFNESNTLITNTGEAAVYLAKYSSHGNVLSSRKLDGTYPESQYQTEQIRIDATGRIYRWSDKLNYGKTLYRYNAQGELIQTKNFNITSTTNSNSVVKSNGFTVMSDGNVIIGGSWLGKFLTIEGQTYAGHSTNSDDQEESDSDAFVVKLSVPDYNISWVYLEKTNEGEEFKYLMSDGLGNIYAAGRWNSMFTPLKIKIRKLNNSGESLWQKEISYKLTDTATKLGIRLITGLAQTRNGGNIWASGYYQENVYFDDSYHFTTPVATSGNFYNGFLVKYGNCNTPNPILTIPENTEICEGESLTLSANLPDLSLNYFWSTPSGNISVNSNGDTTAVLNVSQPGKYALIAQENEECYGKSQEIWITQIPKPDNGITQNNHILTATATGEGITYQWLDCDNNNYPIEGATAQSYTPQTNGFYAVQVTNAKGCSVVSECKSVATLDVKDLKKDAVLLYPNPTESRLFLSTNENIKKINIINMQGQTLQTFRNTKELDVSTLPRGLYILSAKTDKGIWKAKFLKK